MPASAVFEASDTARDGGGEDHDDASRGPGGAVRSPRSRQALSPPIARTLVDLDLVVVVRRVLLGDPRSCPYDYGGSSRTTTADPPAARSIHLGRGEAEAAHPPSGTQKYASAVPRAQRRPLRGMHMHALPVYTPTVRRHSFSEVARLERREYKVADYDAAAYTKDVAAASHRMSSRPSHVVLAVVHASGPSATKATPKSSRAAWRKTKSAWPPDAPAAAYVHGSGPPLPKSIAAFGEAQPGERRVGVGRRGGHVGELDLSARRAG